MSAEKYFTEAAIAKREFDNKVMSGFDKLFKSSNGLKSIVENVEIYADGTSFVDEHEAYLFCVRNRMVNLMLDRDVMNEIEDKLSLAMVNNLDILAYCSGSCACLSWGFIKSKANESKVLSKIAMSNKNLSKNIEDYELAKGISAQYSVAIGTAKIANFKYEAESREKNSVAFKNVKTESNLDDSKSLFESEPDSLPTM